METLQHLWATFGPGIVAALVTFAASALINAWNRFDTPENEAAFAAKYPKWAFLLVLNRLIGPDVKAALQHAAEKRRELKARTLKS